MGSKRKPVKRKPATGKDNLVPAKGWKRDYTVAPPHGEVTPRPLRAPVGEIIFMGIPLDELWQLNWWEYQHRRQVNRTFKLLNRGVPSVDVDTVFFHNGFVVCHPKRMTYALIDRGPGFSAKYNRCDKSEYWVWSPRSNALILDDDTERLVHWMKEKTNDGEISHV